MSQLRHLRAILVGAAASAVLIGAARAENFNIPAGDLKVALDTYAHQTGVQLVMSSAAVKGAHTKGVKGDLTAQEALSRILADTGFMPVNTSQGAFAVVRDTAHSTAPARDLHVADAAPLHAAAAVETVVVTSSKIKGDIQTVPIAITALSQEQLTSRQIAGGPDLVKEVPNLTFSKTNFTGYNIEIRGIGTQAISVTTDPAVAVAFNDIPFIRNHFFEQEFYDVSQVEVLRGPQGTLYGRNATAGVVNVISAKPTDQFEAMASADWGNYRNRRYEGMVNIPLVDDWLELRVAGEWTKRNGYSFNETTNQPIDGRDLWSTRVSLRWRPISQVDANLVWEHFQEDDDRLRSGKQLCKTDVSPTSVGGIPVAPGNLGLYGAFSMGADYLSQGCLPTSLYSSDAFQVPYGYSLPFAVALGIAADAQTGIDPYASTTQSRNLRVIQSTINPHYHAKNDTLELNTDYAVMPSLTFTSQTGYNQDFLWSSEDFNRFDTSPGIFNTLGRANGYGAYGNDEDVTHAISPDGVFCDPQVGCSSRIVAEDLSDEHAWQLSQEFRLSSNFTGPLNFSIGGNYMHYETQENYYVFINTLTLLAIDEPGYGFSRAGTYVPGVTDNSSCIPRRWNTGNWGYQSPNPANKTGSLTTSCIYVDPNPIGKLNDQGHNYFLSQNPYVLNSYAGFGEVYYNLASDLKLTGGLRWTEDKKRFTDIPSEVLTQGVGYWVTNVLNQQWDQLTGRAAVNWSPKLDFTDQTLVYGSYAHGYKAGGANPPGAVLTGSPGQNGNGGNLVNEPIHPLTFRPEFIDAYELGTKNTLFDGALTLNGDVFYYNYKDYQISEIVDRTSINLNFNATVKGAELETNWEPLPGLKFSFAGGYEDTRIANGQSAIDLMDRTDKANHPDWMVVKPFISQTSNCILPTYVVEALLQEAYARENYGANPDPRQGTGYACEEAYNENLDPGTLYPYQPNPSGTGGINYQNQNSSSTEFPIPAGYIGFNPASAPNNGEGFAKNIGGNQLPNAPHFTTSLSADYTMPVSEDWAATLHSDFYWQSQSFARVFNDRPYDKIRGYSNVNLALILTSAGGWQVMGYLKNVFDTTAITGDFLNSDDTGLTTNVFLTDPRLFGVRITKNW